MQRMNDIGMFWCGVVNEPLGEERAIFSYEPFFVCEKGRSVSMEGRPKGNRSAAFFRQNSQAAGALLRSSVPASKAGSMSLGRVHRGRRRFARAPV